MITDIEEIKMRLSHGWDLKTRGDGRKLSTPPNWYGRYSAYDIAADLVALLTAQGCIKTELRLVGSATWVGA